MTSLPHFAQATTTVPGQTRVLCAPYVLPPCDGLRRIFIQSAALVPSRGPAGFPLPKRLAGGADLIRLPAGTERRRPRTLVPGRLKHTNDNVSELFHFDPHKCKRARANEPHAAIEFLKTRSPRPQTYAWSLSECAKTLSVLDKRHSP